MDWGNAIASGIGAAANTGANIIGDQINADRTKQNAIEAEQRAADIKLDLAQRMAASDEMMKNRAAERFAAVVKDKAGEDVPVEAQSVAQTGVTPEAGKAAGYVDVGGTQVGSNLRADPARLKQMIASASAAASNPALSDEQRSEAKELLAALNAQMGAQGDLNAKAAEGQTRKRTTAEAGQAALDDTMQNDPAAFMAGTGMLAAYNKLDDADAKLKLQREQITARMDAAQSRTEMMGEIAKMRLEQAQALGGKDGKLPSDAKMIEYLVAGGMDRKTATDRVVGTGAGATKDPVAMATTLASTLMASGSFPKQKGETEKDYAARMMAAAMDQISSAEGRFRNGGAPAAPAPAPAGSTVPNPVAAPGKPKNDPLGLFN